MKLQRVLNLRMYGEDVKFLQTKLKELGFFNDRIDSNFGQNTLLAVTNFQKSVGTKSDGVVGSLTWNKMMNYGKEVITTSRIPYDISYVNQNGFTIYTHVSITFRRRTIPITFKSSTSHPLGCSNRILSIFNLWHGQKDTHHKLTIRRGGINLFFNGFDRNS